MLDKFVCTVNSLVKTDTFGSEQDDRRIESQLSIVKKDRDKPLGVRFTEVSL